MDIRNSVVRIHDGGMVVRVVVKGKDGEVESLETNYTIPLWKMPRTVTLLFVIVRIGGSWSILVNSLRSWR